VLKLNWAIEVEPAPTPYASPARREYEPTREWMRLRKPSEPDPENVNVPGRFSGPRPTSETRPIPPLTLLNQREESRRPSEYSAEVVSLFIQEERAFE
jgi:hypothetical protein